MLVSACSVNITLVFIMSGGCVTKVHLDTWDLMCLLLSLSPQGSLYLKLWAELYSQHFTISAFQTVPGQQATLHCPPTVYSLTAQHCIHSPLPSRCWSTCDWPVHCVCRGLASPSLSRAAFQFDVTGLGSGIRSVSSTFLLLLLYGMSFIVVWLSTYFLSDGLPTSE